ncbi:chemotaxis protein CheW [Gloeothece verrucosa]|uniref:Chemotaxis protein CheW n=1 Tax=Gloeothece verrucosa (strain PCC 7822) TaxID=497965 RepID=E0U5M2_GLOV7|nr:chemotaxis protein CheW [Gloeothece verrucosa]ADN14735.1 CheW protein [Gloeothece verrucosa PCC 7822]
MELITNNCSNQIGISGDKSCPQLKEVIHCRNCSVYSSIGRALFQREAPAGYLEEWADLLAPPFPQDAQQTNTSKEAATSVIIFRLEEEWLALPVDIIKEITQILPVHTLPHRSNSILRGIVNIRGELITCMALENLLQLKRSQDKNQDNLSKIKQDSVIYQRMIVIKIQNYRWVFKVDELDRINRFDSKDFENSPTALAKNPNIYTKKIISYKSNKVNYLDTELLFYELLFHTYSKPQSNKNNE